MIRQIHFPSWCPECNDTERRSLVKINHVMCESLEVLRELEEDVDKIELQELPEIIAELKVVIAELGAVFIELKEILETLVTDLSTIIHDLTTILDDFKTAIADLATIISTITTKLDAIEQTITQGFTDLLASLSDLQDTLKGNDLVLSTSGAFVNRFTAFTGATNLNQIDCFSIADEARYLFVFDSTDTTTFPIYIATIFPRLNTSFATPSPFQVGVTIGVSTNPAVYEEDTNPTVLVTATRRS